MQSARQREKINMLHYFGIRRAIKIHRLLQDAVSSQLCVAFVCRPHLAKEKDASSSSAVILRLVITNFRPSSLITLKLIITLHMVHQHSSVLCVNLPSHHKVYNIKPSTLPSPTFIALHLRNITFSYVLQTRS